MRRDKDSQTVNSLFFFSLVYCEFSVIVKFHYDVLVFSMLFVSL